MNVGEGPVKLWGDLRKVLAAMLDHYRTYTGYPKTLFTKASEHHHIVVTDDGQVRHLKFGDSLQSGMYVDDPAKSDFRYTEYFHLAWVFKRDIRTVLFLGLGGGSTPKKFHVDYPSIEMDIVEIDPAVVEVAERYFHFRSGPRLNVIIDDARTYLANSTKRYDLIVHDAYFSEAVPYHLITREFFHLAVKRLTPAGVFAFNLISDVVGPDNTLFRAVYKCWKELFSAIYVFPVEGKRNVMLIGCLVGEPLTKDEVVKGAAQLRDEWGNVPLLETHAKHMHTSRVRIDDIPFLQDDVAGSDGGRGYVPVG
ncbi:MAG TPA: fused MFS/spermidine synthase [Alphaproteobacteria bacterium]|nr:fused MFS/spermidine synthase [Alphaproteobacteria bacterium]